MTDFNQFGSAKSPQMGDSESCARCEAMLADVLDGTLSATDQAVFNGHMASCSACSAMLADARRGAEWLEMLRSPRPEPSPALLERILAETCNEPRLIAGERRAPHPLWQHTTILGHPVLSSASPAQAASTKVLPFRERFAAGFRLSSIRHTLLQPRLAMTAAMAFFSITLTLNLTGVHIRDLRVSDLRPSSIRRNFYEANAHIRRYYDNLRVVYELESRVRQLQRANDSDTPYQLPSNPSAPAAAPEQQPPANPARPKPDSRQSRPKPGPGPSRRETPRGNLQFADLWKRPDSIPAATQALVVFTPSILKHLQEGDLV